MKTTFFAILLLGLLGVGICSGYGVGYGDGGSAVDESAVASGASTHKAEASEHSLADNSQSGYDKAKTIGGSGDYQEKSYDYKGPDSVKDQGFKDKTSTNFHENTFSQEVDSSYSGVNNAAYQYPQPRPLYAPQYGYQTPGYGYAKAPAYGYGYAQALGYGYAPAVNGYTGANGYGNANNVAYDTSKTVSNGLH